MRRPTDEQLAAAAPMEIWEQAIAQAKRSPHKRHRTGAVIYAGMGSGAGEVYSTGCSHTHDGGLKVRSMHAEHHAITRLPPMHGGSVCVIVTLTRSGNFAKVSKPCSTCSKLLSKHVWGVVYAEQANDGSWMVFRHSPDTLKDCCETRYQ